MPRFPSFAAIIAWLLPLLLALAANAPAKPLIMIDPGHGGRDIGVVAPGGKAENELMLELAQRLAAALSPQCRTALTRTQDKFMPPEARAAAANRAEAALFVSLHAGAAIDTKIAFQTVFYHQWSPSTAPAPVTTLADAASWGHNQDRHSARSRHLAEALAGARAKMPELPLRLPAQAQAAPLNVLKGVDMPAAVVEVGHLSHPLLADWLSAPLHQDLLAQTLAQALLNFLESPWD